MPAPHPEDLLDQYLAGELTAAEAERVRAYFDAEPGRRATLAAVRATVRGAAYGAPPAVADAHADLLARIHAAERGSSLRRPGVTLPSRGRTAAWLGAGALGVAGFAAVWSAMFLGSGGPPTERQYTARPGQQTTVVLADGSRAQLAPSTTIRVQRDGDETRVAVDGQAFFTVQHRAGSAFVVRTDGLVARVLGTQFAVRQYRGEPLSRLVVAEGRVALSGPRGAAGTVVLAAGGVGVVTDSGTVQVTRDASAADYLAWTSGRLVFTKRPAHEIVSELSRVYGVQVRLADSSLVAQPISWSVSTRTVSLTAALDELGALLDSHYVRTGDVITIIPGRRASTQSTPARFTPAEETFYGR